MICDHDEMDAEDLIWHYAFEHRAVLLAGALGYLLLMAALGLVFWGMPGVA